MLRRHLTYRTGTLVFLWAAITDAIAWAVTTSPVTIRLLPVLTVVCLLLHICRSYSETTPQDRLRQAQEWNEQVRRQVEQHVPVRSTPPPPPPPASGYKVTDKRRLVTWDDSPEPVVHMVDWTNGATLRGRS